MSFRIGNLRVGDKFPPVVIVEIGINHKGNLDLAIDLVDSAIRSGAEIIKHQTHIPEDEMSIEAKKIKPGNSNKSIFNIIKNNCLSEIEEWKLMNYVKQKKKIFISTPFSFKAIDRLKKFNIPAIKIGSGESNNFYFVRYVCNLKKPIILSTGMNSIQSISKSVKIIEQNRIPYALLHCTNLYPTPNNLIRLNCIKELKKNYPKCIVGLSDHSSSIYPAIASVAMGASIIEKHYVDSKKQSGPDVSSSMDKEELKILLKSARIVYESLKGKKIHLPQEKVTSNFAFQSVVSKEKILKGEKFTKKNLTLRRPGNGDYKVRDYKSLIGKISRYNINQNIQIKKKHVK